MTELELISIGGIDVVPHDGLIWLGSQSAGFWRISPFLARNLARELLKASDEAEGNVPSHIYQVDAR